MVRATAVAACALFAGACAPQASRPGPSAEASAARVVAVVDGDTVEVEVGGRTEHVRLLGIDTPETVDPNRPVGCFGPEASARTAELLPEGTEVRLQRDVEGRDHFGRLLAYVFRADDATFVNELLLAEGYAEVLVIEPNGAYAPQLRAAESAARAAGAGLWGSCPDAGR
jgi:micrococcal nuclease